MPDNAWIVLPLIVVIPIAVAFAADEWDEQHGRSNRRYENPFWMLASAVIWASIVVGAAFLILRGGH